MNKLSKYMYGVGFGIVVLSIVRWVIIYSDLSQAILGVAIGIIVLGFADIYNERKSVQDRLDKLDRRCDSISDWFIKEELK